MRALSTISRFLAIALVAGLTLGACDDDDDPFNPLDDPEFEANLTGAAERPDPVTTDATGEAGIDFDEEEVRFFIDLEDITDVTLAHIHVGDANTAGPIVVELFNAGGTPVSFTDRDNLVDDTFTEADIVVAGGIETLEDLLDAMEAGNTYVNVHTTANPNGEVRGQLVPHD
ncbi:MAG TPA: CHRD domain-containing protein [Gemmatimonadota bacterium]|nr:CHRD domain-containing protein [Gemmatimonadota bacterium]